MPQCSSALCCYGLYACAVLVCVRCVASMLYWFGSLLRRACLCCICVASTEDKFDEEEDLADRTQLWQVPLPVLAEAVSPQEVQMDMQLQVGGSDSDPHYGLVGVVVFKGVIKVDGVKDLYVGLLLYAPLGDTDGKLGDHRCVGALVFVCLLSHRNADTLHARTTMVCSSQPRSYIVPRASRSSTLSGLCKNSSRNSTGLLAMMRRHPVALLRANLSSENQAAPVTTTTTSTPFKMKKRRSNWWVSGM